MGIYTKGGDNGETSLLFGGRTEKDDCRIELVGTVDELSALLGVVKAYCEDDMYVSLIAGIQRDLISVSGYFVSLGENKEKDFGTTLTNERVAELEGIIDEIQAVLPPPNGFILYGANALSAHVHVARAVCRRAERRMYTVNKSYEISPAVKQYFNRLSDLLFSYGRLVE